MKIFIIEGMDNTGKDTLISSLIERLTVSNTIYKTIHCSKPNGNTNEERILSQNLFFGKMVTDIISDYEHNAEDFIILNRSYQGEYVYGSLYRDRKNTELTELLNELDRRLIKHIKKDDIYYIQLLSSSVKLLKDNDDNLSLSDGDKEKMKIEIERFTDAFNLSNLPNKKLIYVNKGDKFRSREDIRNEIFDFCKI